MNVDKIKIKDTREVVIKELVGNNYILNVEETTLNFEKGAKVNENEVIL